MPRPASPWSLRWRLWAATAVAVATALALSGWALAGLFHDQVNRQFLAALTEQLDQLTGLLEVDAQGRPTLDGTRLADPRWQRPQSGLYWQIDRHGPGGVQRGVLRSRSLWDAELLAPADALAPGALHQHTLPGPGGVPLWLVERTVTLAEADGSAWRLMVAADRQPLARAEQGFTRALAASLAVLLLLLLLAAAAQVAVGLAPLRSLRQALERLRSGRTHRLEGRFPSEVQPLVEDLNGVLDRHAELLERARTQAGNLAHALKTPLAVLAQAADAIDPTATSGAALAGTLREQVASARRQVDWHLRRARAAAAPGLPGQRCEVAPLVQGLLRTLQRLHAARGLQLSADLPPGLAFAGEPQDLQEMLGNLLDNACRHAAAQVELRGQASADAAGAAAGLQITVDDDGPGIPPEQQDLALRRGVRLDEQGPGSGLGLSIVQELADLYGGRLELGASPLGGLQARLQLPLSPAPR